MKITDVEAVALGIPLKKLEPPSPWAEGASKQIVVKVHTDEGLVGIGEAFSLGTPLAVCNVIEEGLKPLLLGEDPSDIEALVQKMQRAVFIFGRRGITLFAVSGVEIALWDIMGKANGVPLCRMLGGSPERKIKAYSSLLRYERPEHVAQAAKEAASLGYTMIKLHQTDEASLRAAREAVGDDVELMMDVNCAWNPREAVEMARRFEEYNLYWLEEPVWPPEDYQGLSYVASQVDIPLAAGECDCTIYGFRELVDAGAASILQPSVTKVGGVLEWRKVAALAEAYNLTVAPHSPYFGAGFAATLHLAAASPSVCSAVEFLHCGLEEHVLASPPRVENGYVTVPSGPGLGIEINEEAIEKFPYTKTERRLLNF